MGWVVQLMTVLGVLSGQSTATFSAVRNLPPAPPQMSIVCHDAVWEQEDLKNVAGSQVHKKLAPFIDALLAETTKDNVSMYITVAYRNCPYQLQLRSANCGLGDYNLYIRPSNLCEPPTEPASKSMHNEGLAIDFACYGYDLFEYSPCFTWLKQHALTYHLQNHAIEAWHWSTTGI